MNRNIVSLTLALCFSVSIALGQQTTPSPSPTPANEDDVVKISTNLVQIDVTVTDKSGHPIKDLRRDEIEVYQNGKKQDISNVSFVDSGSPMVDNVRNKERPQEARLELPPPVSISPENVRRTIAIVIDDLNMSFSDVYFVRKAIKKFIDVQMQPGDLIAIIRTGGGIGALQQFSNDKRQLYAAVDRIEWNPAGKAGIAAFAPVVAKPALAEAEPEKKDGEVPVDLKRPNERKMLDDLNQASEDFRSGVFAVGTLGAVNYVVRGMAELPGRKSIMLISDGFKLFMKDRNGFAETGRIMQALRFLIDNANRASVVIYGLDPRGLVDTSLTAADDVSGFTLEELNALQEARNAEISDTQDGLRYLSRETGGFAVYNSNDLSRGIRNILDDQSYYLVGYSPDDGTFDPKQGKYNQLVVKVLREGARVRYRRGFFGVENLAKTGRPKTVQERMLYALTSPFATNDVEVRLNALFTYDTHEGAFIRSLLHVDGSDVTVVDAPNGEKAVTFDILGIALGDNGALIDQVAKTYTITLKPEAAERLKASGFVYNFLFPMKKPGAYQMRIAIRDHGSDKIGSATQFIEVPNLKKNRLSLSGVALDNFTFDEYKRLSSGASGGEKRSTDPIAATAERIFKRGTVLAYGFSIYNAKASSNDTPELTSQVRLLRDGQLVFAGKALPVPKGAPDPANGIDVTASLNLGTEIKPGDYVLQILVTDHRAKDKYQTASQFVQFRVVE